MYTLMGTLATMSFRPLPGILYSNNDKPSKKDGGVVSVPFRGSFIQIGGGMPEGRVVEFPSPSGDPLFKWTILCQQSTE